MHMFRLEKKHGEDRKHIAFKCSPEDQEFRRACEVALGKHGFMFDFDGYYFRVWHPNPESPLSSLSIASDEWGCIWGEGKQWGSIESNHKAISELASLLIESRLFHQE